MLVLLVPDRIAQLLQFSCDVVPGDFIRLGSQLPTRQEQDSEPGPIPGVIISVEHDQSIVWKQIGYLVPLQFPVLEV